MSYGAFCLTTESKDLKAIRDRLNENKVRRLLFDLLVDHVETMRHLDTIKKYVYYGKQGEIGEHALDGLPYSPKAFSDDNVIRRLHCVLGIVTEGVELSEHMIKELFLGEQVSQETWLKELGDPCWYTAIGADTIGLTFDDVLQANVAKLTARYKKAGFSEKRAQEHKGD